MKIAILMTCFNRRESTIKCLRLLANQKVDNKFLINTYLVDDGSSDGTSEAIAEEFPQINIIKGNGSLYWNGGMRLAWKHAQKNNYDLYLWLNDDSYIYENALERIITTYQRLIDDGQKPGAILGSMESAKDKQITYGGRKSTNWHSPIKTSGVIKPGLNPIECDFVNGNFTLIPSASVSAIGILNEKFTHGMGDFDYGLRLKKAGFTCWIAPGVFGTCEANASFNDWKNTDLPMQERISKIQNLTQQPPPKEWMIYVKMHGGITWPLLWLSAWLRLRFPAIWIKLHDLAKR